MSNLKDTTEPSQEHSPIAPKSGNVRLWSLYLIVLVAWIWLAILNPGDDDKLTGILARIAVGMVVLGILLRVIVAVIPSKKPDLFVSAAYSISLSLIIALICLIMLGVFSSGFALTYPVICGVLSGGILVGFRYALVSWNRRGTKAPTPQGNAEPETDSAISPRCGGWGNGLFGFTLGVIASILITFFVFYLTQGFYGPTLGVTELGTPRYQNDPTPIYIATGLAIMGVGWTLGITSFWLRFRAFAAGLIVSTTILGLLAFNYK